MIRVDNLVKRWHAPHRGLFTAVDHISFSVEAGEVYGLLGPNGAGKTTTIRMLATIVQPDEGQIQLAGIDVLADPIGARARLTHVPAEAGLPPRLTPREVVRLFARIQGVKDPIARTDALLDRLGTSSYMDTPCGELSTGMKRRVVLARGLVHEPQVLLLDEPTDGLDVKGRREVLDLVREQARAGRTIIISSHIMFEVERVVDRVGIVDRGRLVAEGTLDHILETSKTDNLDDAFLSLTGSETP